MMGLPGSLLATFTTTAVKNSRKNEFWFFKTLSRLFSLAQCVRTNFLGNWILKDSSKIIKKKREKNRRRSLTSSSPSDRALRRFTSYSCSECKRSRRRSVMHVQSCWVFSIFFFFAKNVRKCNENVHRVKKVIHLSRPNSTWWRIVVKSHKWNTQFSRINCHREDRTTFSNFHYLTRIFRGTRKKRVCVCSIYTPTGISW